MMLVSAPAWAQTDADKATARTLAEEGIELKQAGKYEEALDKLTRAQQIFDAPTHLLLIAECQVSLGKLVEGAETYRRLQRRKIDDKAPAAFRSAQKRGADELAAVEPRIPKIRLKLLPEGVHGFKVRIDSVQVPSAVVGVDRLANPGHHVVEVSAPGYRTAQVQLQLSEGQVLPVEVKLERDGSALAPPPTGPAEPPPAYAVPKPPPPGEPHEAEEDGGLDLLLALRLKTAFPGGDFGTTTFDGTGQSGDVKGGNVADSFGPGGGIELQGALRFADNWAGVVFFGADGFGKVSSDKYGVDLAALYDNASDFRAKESSAPYAGLGGQWYSCPDCLGVVAEIAFMVRQFTQTVEFTHTNPTTSTTNTCQVSVGRSTPMLRLLAGFQVPVGDETVLTPFTSYAGGGVSTTRLEPTGEGGDGCPTSTSESTNQSESSSVYLLTVGIAGTMSFGL